MSTTTHNDDERTEKAVIGGAVALALVVGLGFAAHKVGLLDDVLGGAGPLKTASKIVEALKAQAKDTDGSPPRIMLSGTVANDKEIARLLAATKRAFPASEVKSSLRADARAVEKKRTIVRVSVAADAISEAWPRPRFGDVKRMEIMWRDDKLTLRGAVFSASANQALTAAFNTIPPTARGAYQVREVIRSVVPAMKLQEDLITALNGRAIAFDEATGTLKADDAEAAAILDAIAPQLKDLRGLEIIISAGHAERERAMRQAEAIRAALVARGADAAGLRPMPAPKNNLLSLIVREKE